MKDLLNQGKQKTLKIFQEYFPEIRKIEILHWKSIPNN